MKKILIAAAVLAATPVLAQPVPTILPNPTQAEGTAPRPERGRGIPTALAIEAAVAANDSCKAGGNITTTAVVDSEGTPIVIISNDGARAITQRIAQGKAMIALKTKGPSDPAVAGKADPAVMGPLGVARPGGFPLMAGNDLVGAIAVSGAPSGQIDEGCARAGIAKISARIK
jgi:uncharacterized protein GlcG (DUF336 family)